MEIIVLQHIKIEDPGYIKDLMLSDSFNLTTIELDQGEKIPKNLSKFNGVVMLGGVTLNGEQVYQQAQDDIEKLEREVRESYDLPVDYMIG